MTMLLLLLLLLLFCPCCCRCSSITTLHPFVVRFWRRAAWEQCPIVSLPLPLLQRPMLCWRTKKQKQMAQLSGETPHPNSARWLRSTRCLRALRRWRCCMPCCHA